MTDVEIQRIRFDSYILPFVASCRPIRKMGLSAQKTAALLRFHRNVHIEMKWLKITAVLNNMCNSPFSGPLGHWKSTRGKNIRHKIRGERIFFQTVRRRIIRMTHQDWNRINGSGSETSDLVQDNNDKRLVIAIFSGLVFVKYFRSWIGIHREIDAGWKRYEKRYMFPPFFSPFVNVLRNY